MIGGNESKLRIITKCSFSISDILSDQIISTFKYIIIKMLKPRKLENVDFYITKFIVSGFSGQNHCIAYCKF